MYIELMTYDGQIIRDVIRDKGDFELIKAHTVRVRDKIYRVIYVMLDFRDKPRITDFL